MTPIDAVVEVVERWHGVAGPEMRVDLEETVGEVVATAYSAGYKHGHARALTESL